MTAPSALFTLLCSRLLVEALCDKLPAPPHNVSVENWLMSWATAPAEPDVTYTVQYSRFDVGTWSNVTSCVSISSTECDISATKDLDERGCVMLRVRAERRSLASAPVQACSHHGDSCSPEVGLSPRPGSLTVHLKEDHILAVENAAHAKHQVCWSKKEEPLKRTCREKVSSLSIQGLEEGQSYCVDVQYMLFNKMIGLPSCNRCALIPKSKQTSRDTLIILSVLLIIVPLILTPILVYVFMFRCQKFKRWLRTNNYQIPEHFLLQPFPEHHLPVDTSNPREEHFDKVSPTIPEGFPRGPA